MFDVMPGYEKMAIVFQRALNQMQNGKGKERHVIEGENLPVDEQVSAWIQKQGFDYLRGQMVKKAHESLRLPIEQAIKEMIHAINEGALWVVIAQDKLIKQNHDEGQTKETMTISYTPTFSGKLP